MQRGALVALGLTPMWFPTYYRNSSICGSTFNYLFEPTQQVWWNPKCYENCWYIDAFTVDATLLASHVKGIWDKTAGRPPKIASNTAGAKIGSLPKVMVYIACHKDHGTRAFFLYHGAKHGGKASTKTDKGHMYAGFRFWYHDLTDCELMHIKAMSYYSNEATLTKFEARVGEAVRKTMGTDAFDPRFFLVCLHHSSYILRPPGQHLVHLILPEAVTRIFYGTLTNLDAQCLEWPTDLFVITPLCERSVLMLGAVNLYPDNIICLCVCWHLDKDGPWPSFNDQIMPFVWARDQGATQRSSLVHAC